MWVAIHIVHKPKLIYRSFYRIFGTYYPIKYLQDMDIQNKKIIEEKLEIDCCLWRNHAYFNDDI